MAAPNFLLVLVALLYHLTPAFASNSSEPTFTPTAIPFITNATSNRNFPEFEPPRIAPLAPKQMVRSMITGYGAHYYTIEVPVWSFLDVILIDERNGFDEDPNFGTNRSCAGWYLVLNVSREKPALCSRHLDIQTLTRGFDTTFWRLVQHGPWLSKLLASSTRVSVKAAEPDTWWILVQTQQISAAYDTGECRYRIYANTHPRMSFLTIGIGCCVLILAWCVGWHCFTTLLFAQYHTAWDRWSWAMLMLFGPKMVLAWLFRVLKFCTAKSCFFAMQWLSQLRTRVRKEPKTGAHIEVELEAPPPDPQNETQPTPQISNAAEDVPVCRICREGSSALEPLIEPCGCRGTANFVHMTCLNQWRDTIIAGGHPENAVRCEVCRQEFHLVFEVPSNWTRLLVLFTLLGTHLGCVCTVVLPIIVTIYLMVWFVTTVLVYWTCWDSYDEPALNSSHHVSVVGGLFGFMFYELFILQVHRAATWQYAIGLWRNRSQPTQPQPGDQQPDANRVEPFNFIVIIRMCVHWVHLIVLTSAVGYMAMFVLYLCSESLVWSWSLSPFLSTVLFEVLSAIVFVVHITALGFAYLSHWWQTFPTSNGTVRILNRRPNGNAEALQLQSVPSPAPPTNTEEDAVTRLINEVD